MKRLFSALLIVVLLFLCGCEKEKRPEISIADELIKAIWIYYDELSMVDQNGGTENSFTNKITEIFEKCKSNGFNTVFVQVRPFGDAFYKSKIFPWSEYLTGEQGEGIDYDPLKIMVTQAHKIQLSIHAWINPFRISFSTELNKLPSNNPAINMIKKKDNSVVILEKGIYYCPASVTAQKLIIDGIREIVKNYDVDGIHIDDYFYPSTDEKVDMFFYNKYKSNGGILSLDDWRLNNISAFVQGIYNAIKSINERCIFSISPAGNIENNYNEQYADVKLWCSKNGFCDWIIPQIYYGFENKKLSFDSACQQWERIVQYSDIKTVFGLAAYRVGGKDEKDEWKIENRIIDKQIEYINKLEKYDGYSLFSYSSIFK